MYYNLKDNEKIRIINEEVMTISALNSILTDVLSYREVCDLLTLVITIEKHLKIIRGLF